ALVRAYGLDPADVRVIAPDVGGGFGAKIGAHPEDLVLPWLARRVGRPVRWVETRTENMTAMVHGRAQVHEVTIGGRRDGTIEAYHLDIVQDAGAYPAMGAYLPRLTQAMAAGTYAVDRVTSRSRVVVTTTTPVASYRGAGRPRPSSGPSTCSRPRSGSTPPRCGGATSSPGSTSPTRRPPGPPTTPATTRQRSSGPWPRPATRSCGPSRPGAGKPATRSPSASGCRPTSR